MFQIAEHLQCCFIFLFYIDFFIPLDCKLPEGKKYAFIASLFLALNIVSEYSSSSISMN